MGPPPIVIHDSERASQEAQLKGRWRDEGGEDCWGLGCGVGGGAGAGAPDTCCDTKGSV